MTTKNAETSAPRDLVTTSNVGSNLRKTVDELLAAGLSIIPIRMPEKVPTVPWKEFQSRAPYIGELQYNSAIGLVCGRGVEVVDIDAKNDTTLVERFQGAIDEHCPDILEHVTAQKTVSGGLHLIYRCNVIAGNQKLAMKSKEVTLIETRGAGGYIVIAPTPGYQLTQGAFEDIPTITPEQREQLHEAARSLNEYFEPVRFPRKEPATDGITPWDDYNVRADVPALLESHGWKFVRKQGESELWRRPGKDHGHSASWNGTTFYNFSSSTALDPSKAYSPAALYTYLEHSGNFTEANSKLYSLGYGERHYGQHANAGELRTQDKDFKDYIIREEPTEEKGIISINGVNVLSDGNVLLLTGPMKARKTMLASILVNQCKLKTAYIDSEQGRKHSWRTGKFTPTADVFHLRGEDQKEITRVINCCIDSGEYQLIVLDNLRDLLLDFNNVEQSGGLELFLKRISERLPVIAILHENKNSKTGQGHIGHGAAKIAQTTIRVELVDVEDPAQGSVVECVHSRDEPFKRAFISVDGKLTCDALIKSAGRSMLLDDLLMRIGGQEYTRTELNETYADVFGIKPGTAGNEISKLRRAHPWIITERKEGKTKFYNVSSTVK